MSIQIFERFSKAKCYTYSSSFSLGAWPLCFSNESFRFMCFFKTKNCFLWEKFYLHQIRMHSASSTIRSFLWRFGEKFWCHYSKKNFYLLLQGRAGTHEVTNGKICKKKAFAWWIKDSSSTLKKHNNIYLNWDLVAFTTETSAPSPKV